MHAIIQTLGLTMCHWLQVTHTTDFSKTLETEHKQKCAVIIIKHEPYLDMWFLLLDVHQRRQMCSNYKFS